ncbi:MAG: ribonuclease H [Bacteroidales bacterium]|nr:ribonuclease H [Bacteroidales bacterium]
MAKYPETHLPRKNHQPKLSPDTYYVWVGGSCDYAHEKRDSAGAYIMMLNDAVIEEFVISDDHTTEFRMILSVMNHVMEVIPEKSDIVFLTNVQYIQQNYSKTPSGKSANADLIENCISLIGRHSSVTVKTIPYHSSENLYRTHELAHEAMLERMHK